MTALDMFDKSIANSRTIPQHRPLNSIHRKCTTSSATVDWTLSQCQETLLVLLALVTLLDLVRQASRAVGGH